MNYRTILLSAAIILSAGMGADAQSLFDFDLPGLFGRQENRSEENPLKLEYNIDFQYFLDYRDFNVSENIFAMSNIYHIARFSPSIIFRYDQDSKFTHRAILGVDLTKNLGEVPTEEENYSASEHSQGLRNYNLFKDIFFYYQLRAKAGNGMIDFYAGIHPRSALGGDYARAVLADDLIYYDPNIEGLTIKYTAPKFSAEITGDYLGRRGLDRLGAVMALSAGAWQPYRWLSAGWSGAFTHVMGNYFASCNVDNAVFNPYVKLDAASFLHMQEFSVKAGPIATFQFDHYIEGETPHFPMGFEGVLNIRHWNIGIEDTYYFGEDLMTYMNGDYASVSRNATYASTLYSGQTFYFTRRSVPTWYNRAEIYYAPSLNDILKIRFSGVGHFVTPAGEIGPFIGWQAKASVMFNLDAFRTRPESVREQTRRGSGRRDGRSGGDRRQGRERRSGGPIISL